jgi:hypothetical protein
VIRIDRIDDSCACVLRVGKGRVENNNQILCSFAFGAHDAYEILASCSTRLHFTAVYLTLSQCIQDREKGRAQSQSETVHDPRQTAIMQAQVRITRKARKVVRALLHLSQYFVVGHRAYSVLR